MRHNISSIYKYQAKKTDFGGKFKRKLKGRHFTVKGSQIT